MNEWPYKILVKYASRGRMDRFFGGMDTIYSLAELPEYVFTLVTADEDDEKMNNDFVRNKLKTYPNTEIIYGRSESKIHACNRDLDNLPEQMKDYSILCNFSDDMRWTMPKWDTHIRVDFNSVFPELDGYMAYRDPDTQGALSTLFIAGRKWVDMFKFIYDPQFISLFCDNLVEDCAKHLGKYHYTGYDIYRHYNSAYNYPEFPKDEMFILQQDIGWSIDQNTYYRIKGEGIENYLKKFIKS